MMTKLRGNGGAFPQLLSRITAAVCVLGMSVMLGACHGSGERNTFEMPDSLDTTTQREITFWAKNDTNRTQVDIYESAIESFQELYPNIKVNIRLYTNYGDIYNDVITNIATGTTPNVCITYPDHIATYLSGENTVVPLDELMEDPQYGLGGSRVLFDSPRKDEIVPQFLQECAIGTQIYALPYMRSTEACYINKTYVEALGYEVPDVLTWDFVWEVSEKAMEKDENGLFRVNGQKVLIPFLYKSTDNMMITMLRQSGADYTTNGGEILLFHDTTKDYLMTIARHGQTKAFSTFKISGYPANFLNAGQCIFAVDSTAGATWMGSEAPLCDISRDKIVDFDTVVRMVPQFDPENPKMISQGPSVCVFNKEDPQDILASWLFAQYLLSDEVQIAYSCTEGYIPVTTKAQNTAEYREYLASEGVDNTTHYAVKIQAAKLLLDNVQNTFVTPVFNGSASVRDAASQLVESTVKSVRRKETVDDAYMEKLFRDVTGLYRLDSQGNSADRKMDLGPLPPASKILLGTLILVWIGIICYIIMQYYRKKG